MVEDCVILGGGVAGLSAANYLVDNGVKPLIIDASRYPAHRICGEFLSHECHPILENWGIATTQDITKARFIGNKRSFEFKLPIKAASRSRYEFDEMLFERAKKKGAKTLIDSEVVEINFSENYELKLSNGQTILAKNLMIGTGRIPKISKPLQMKYIGFKAHFEGIDIDAVEMHTFKGGYMGVSKVDPKTTNIACLLDINVEDPEKFVQNMVEERFPNAKMIFPKWLIGRIPEFGIRNNPELERVYWIGDAAGSIPPICGEGLAIAITSGCMAGEYYLKLNSREFHNDWLKRYRRRFFVAIQIHRIMTSPTLTTLAIMACKAFPSLPILSWKLTRE